MSKGLSDKYFATYRDLYDFDYRLNSFEKLNRRTKVKELTINCREIIRNCLIFLFVENSMLIERVLEPA